MTLHRRHRISALSIREISSVDRPAQLGATVALMKRAATDVTKNAAAVAAGHPTSFGVADYEDAMFVRARQLAEEQRITPEQALMRNLSRDRELMDLAHASEVARVAAYGVAVRKRNGEGLA